MENVIWTSLLWVLREKIQLFEVQKIRMEQRGFHEVQVQVLQLQLQLDLSLQHSELILDDPLDNQQACVEWCDLNQVMVETHDME